MPGDRLTGEDRERIAAGLVEGLGFAEIGRRLGRPASTIMREVTRNGGPDGYKAQRAQEATKHRAHRRKRAQPPPPAGDSSHGRDPQAVHDVTEAFGELLEQQGMPRIAARMLACLNVTDSGALTAAELVQRLRVSPASISQTVAFLEQQGLLKRERPPGERRERYVVDDDLWVRSTFAAREMNETLAAASQRAAEILGADTPAGARFGESAEFLRLVNVNLQQLMEQWQRRQADRRTPTEVADTSP